MQGKSNQVTTIDDYIEILIFFNFHDLDLHPMTLVLKTWSRLVWWPTAIPEIRSIDQLV